MELGLLGNALFKVALVSLARISGVLFGIVIRRTFRETCQIVALTFVTRYIMYLVDYLIIRTGDISYSSPALARSPEFSLPFHDTATFIKCQIKFTGLFVT